MRRFAMLLGCLTVLATAGAVAQAPPPVPEAVYRDSVLDTSGLKFFLWGQPVLERLAVWEAWSAVNQREMGGCLYGTTKGDTLYVAVAERALAYTVQTDTSITMTCNVSPYYIGTAHIHIYGPLNYRTVSNDHALLHEEASSFIKVVVHAGRLVVLKRERAYFPAWPYREHR